MIAGKCFAFVGDLSEIAGAAGNGGLIYKPA